MKNQRRSFSAEGQSAGGHLVKHHAEGKQVGARIQFFSLGLLGRHIGDGAQSRARTGEVFFDHDGSRGGHVGDFAGGGGNGLHFGQAEVEDLGVAAFGDENIGRLDVAVHDAAGVRGIEGVGNFDSQGEDCFQLHGPVADQVLERGAVEELHDQEGAVPFLANVVDSTDVGMIEGGSGLGLAAKTLQSLAVLGEVFGKELEGDEAPKSCVFSFVDHTHTAATELFDDPVM